MSETNERALQVIRRLGNVKTGGLDPKGKVAVNLAYQFLIDEYFEGVNPDA
jgi:hypothetical protein